MLRKCYTFHRCCFAIAHQTLLCDVCLYAIRLYTEEVNNCDTPVQRRYTRCHHFKFKRNNNNKKVKFLQVYFSVSGSTDGNVCFLFMSYQLQVLSVVFLERPLMMMVSILIILCFPLITHSFIARMYAYILDKRRTSTKRRFIRVSLENSPVIKRQQ